MGTDDSERTDAPPGTALLETVLGPPAERASWLGTFTSDTYPDHLRELLHRREEVSRELLTMDLATAEARIEMIPRLRELLSRYPHPLVYDTLINAYLDAERYDEARGVVFAARQRRLECERSEHPEIRAEVSNLRDWKPEDIKAPGSSR